MPALALYYSIKPWDIERLTFREIDLFVADAARLNQLSKPKRG